MTNENSFKLSGWSLVLGYLVIHSKSAQWELNPHFRHGKAAGYRYIMGAFKIIKLLTNQNGIRGARTLTDLVKSQACCL